MHSVTKKRAIKNETKSLLLNQKDQCKCSAFIGTLDATLVLLPKALEDANTENATNWTNVAKKPSLNEYIALSIPGPLAAKAIQLSDATVKTTAGSLVNRRLHSVKSASLIVNTVIAQDPESQSHKPDSSEPENPLHTQLAMLIAGDSDVFTSTKETRPQPNQPHTIRQIRKLLAGFKLHSSAETIPMGAPPKELLGAATQLPGPQSNTFPLKPRQNAQETKKTQVCLNSLNSSKSGRPKGIIEKAPSSSGRNFRPREKLRPPKTNSDFNKLCDIKQSVCLEQQSLIAPTENWLTPDVSATKISIDGYSGFRADPKRKRAARNRMNRKPPKRIRLLLNKRSQLFFKTLTAGNTEDKLAFRKMRNRCKSESRQ
ncbi:hypothetical protein CLF_112476 [Clonorchis sinensis]|uniref:Uncharacterized protein n=1 Tax=Clonorchis sinensis TaxID=79923 RepID=G7YWF5_CLOSI|nr:hypothetical protein CLF_112476 [Clonorchis sinensis]